MKYFENRGYIIRTFLLCPTRSSANLYTNLKTLKSTDSFIDEHQFQLALALFLSMNTYRTNKNTSECIVQRKVHRHSWLYKNKGCSNADGVVPELICKPSHMLIMDDAQGTGLYTKPCRDLLSHIVIKHRHMPITIALLAQLWTVIPRGIRLNTTHFAVE